MCGQDNEDIFKQAFRCTSKNIPLHWVKIFLVFCGF